MWVVTREEAVVVVVLWRAHEAAWIAGRGCPSWEACAHLRDAFDDAVELLEITKGAGVGMRPRRPAASARTVDAELARLDALLRSALGALYWPTRRTVEALSAAHDAAREWVWIFAGA